MAATGYTPIQLYYSTTAAAVPLAANLAQGELAINITDGKLYYENNSGVVTLLASAAGASGDVVGPSSATDNALARFDSTTGKLIQNSVGILSDAGVLTGLTGLTSSGNITLSSLTSTRVPYASTGGLLIDSANMTFSGTVLTVSDGVTLSANAAKFQSSYGGVTTTNLFTDSGGGVLSVDGSNTISLRTGGVSGTSVAVVSPTNLTVTANTGATNTGDNNTVIVAATTSGAYASSYGAGLQFQITNSSGGYSGSRIVSRLNPDNNTANLIFQARNYGFSDSMNLDANGILIVGGTSSDLTGSSRLISIGNFSVQYAATTGTYLQIVPNAANGSVEIKADARSGSYPPINFLTSNLTRLSITASGVVAVGNPSNIALSGWASAPAIQVGNSANFYGDGIYYNWVAGTSLNSYRSANSWYNTSASIPTARFEIGNGGAGSESGFTWYWGAGGTAGALANQSQFMRLSDSGNLSVGTSSQQGRITVSSVGGSGYYNVYATASNIANPNSTGSEIIGAQYTVGSNIIVSERQPNGAYADRTDLAFITNTGYGLGQSEKMRLDAGGSLFLTGGFIPSNASRLVVRGTSAGSYNNTFSQSDATAQIISSEMGSNQWYPTLNIAMVRQSLTTGNGAFGGIGFSTIDDSNNSGQYDAGRIAVVNEQGTAVLSATSMAFYTQSGYVSNTNASTERGRFNSVGGFNVGNTQNTFGAGVFVGANGSRLQSYQNVNVAQNTATNITPSGALAGDGCYLVQVTARGLGNSNNNRTKLYLVLFRAVSFSGSSITQIADVFPDTGTGGEITTLTTTLTFYSNADPCITVTAASRSGGSNTAVYVSIMGY